MTSVRKSQTTSEQAVEDQAKEIVTRVTPDGKAILDEGEQPLRILGLSQPKD